MGTIDWENGTGDSEEMRWTAKRSRRSLQRPSFHVDKVRFAQYVLPNGPIIWLRFTTLRFMARHSRLQIYTRYYILKKKI